MMKYGRKLMAGVMGVSLFSTMVLTTAFAGTWVTDGGRWRYRDDMGMQISGSWIQDGNEYYMTDESGYMRIGWVLDHGNWYFLDTRIGGPQGKRMTGWQWIDGKCYYLDPLQNGAAVLDSVTPDGYRVDASGAWVDESGNVCYEEGKGISSTQVVDIRTMNPGGALTKGGGTPGGGGSGSGGSGGGSSSSISWDEEWGDYSDSSVGYSANDFKNGNYDQMTSKQREKVKEAIADFKESYLTESMSDFEKEIMIIRWLVENCTYECVDGWANSTAYSCIVNGEAQCAGYADAFLQTAKSCGLDVRYVSNNDHAWNLIRLDDDWYHVDVTWEDPIGDNSYGFSSLRNKYINLEDSVIRGISSHRTWSPSSIKCNGSKYGPAVVKQYLNDGTVDTSQGESQEEYANHLIESTRNEDGSNIIEFTNVEETSERICNYLSKQLEERQTEMAFIVRYPSSYSSYKSGNRSKVGKLSREIRTRVEERINAQYGEILKYDIIAFMFTHTDGDGNYFGIAEQKIQYADIKPTKATPSSASER